MDRICDPLMFLVNNLTVVTVMVPVIVPGLVAVIVSQRFQCITQVNRMLKYPLIGTEVLSADLRAGVYQCQLRSEGKPALDPLLKLMTGTDLQEEKVRIIASLGSVGEDELIQQVLQLSMSGDIRSQDMDTCVAGCLATTKGMHT